MDVRNWPLDKIMQLPDHCFGRRWPLITTNLVVPETTVQWLLSQALPDRCVLWGIHWWAGENGLYTNWLKFALGDHAPANDAAFDGFERLFPGDLDNTFEEGAILWTIHSSLGFDCRLPILAMGRRFAVQIANAHTTAGNTITIVFLVSSIPTEVPDCLLSV